MIPAIRYYRNQSSQPCVHAEPEHILLGDYLAGDLQDGAIATEVLAALKNVATQGEQEMIGNSFSVTLDKDQVALETLFDDDEDDDEEAEAEAEVEVEVEVEAGAGADGYYRLPTAKFQTLLTSWIEFLDDDGLLAFVPKF